MFSTQSVPAFQGWLSVVLSLQYITLRFLIIPVDGNQSMKQIDIWFHARYVFNSCIVSSKELIVGSILINFLN